MLTKGNPIIKTRIKKSDLARIVAYLDKRGNNPTAEPWTLSDFIRVAVTEKLDKLERGRKKVGK